MGGFLTQINDAMVAVMDVLLGWSLHLPANSALIIVSVLSAAALTWARVLVTDQGMLHRCADDKKTLGRLIRETRRSRDLDKAARKVDVKRYKLNKNLVALKTLKAEGKPLLVSLLPILLLATWAFARLACLPVPEAEPVRVSAYFPLSAVGEVAHILPLDGLACEGDWIAGIVPDVVADAASANAVAVWELKGTARPEPYILKLRWRDETWEQPLRIGGTTYEPPVTPQGDWPQSTEVHLAQGKLFGIVPGLGPFLPPWLVGYLLVVIPCVFGIKKLFNVK
jgi:uncharacterized membrane protein (DUF106 family)